MRQLFREEMLMVVESVVSMIDADAGAGEAIGVSLALFRFEVDSRLCPRSPSSRPARS